MLVDNRNAPAARERPGAGTRKRGPDASENLQPGGADMSARYEAIDGHPGYYRRAGAVAFRYQTRRGRKWGTAPTIRAAKRRKQELETDALRGLIGTGNKITFEAYGRTWIDSYAGRTSNGIRTTTINDYRDRLEHHAFPFLGPVRLSDIAATDVRAFVAHVAAKQNPRTKKPLSKDSVRLALAPVRAMLATARDDGLIPTNPAAGIRVIAHHQDDEDESSTMAKAWTPDELQRLLVQLPKRERLFCAFLVESGLRIGEAVEVRKRDIDFGTRQLHVRRTYYEGRIGKPKTRHGRRTIRLSDRLARELWPLTAKSAPDDLVFTSVRGARVNPKNLAARVLVPAAKNAGVNWLGWHGFRHTSATTLFRAGANAKQVQAWLGHHSPAFTLATYVHLLEEDLPDPPALAAVALAGCDHLCDHFATRTPRNVPKAVTAEAAVMQGKAR
jgi:integrase